MRAAADAAQQMNRSTVAAFEAEKADLRRRVGKLMTALAETTAQARGTTVPEWTEVADTLTEGALRLAAAALARELESVDDALLTSVKGAIRRLSQPGDAVVHLNPVEAELLDGAVPGVEVVADAGVPPGSVVALTPAQRLRHDLPAALAAAEEVLRA
jgi:flagellar biosynthesis/type III secretory pathway protein FliH